MGLDRRIWSLDVAYRHKDHFEATRDGDLLRDIQRTLIADQIGIWNFHK